MGEEGYVGLVRQVMAEVLDVPDVAETDNFFSSGGDSMGAIRLGWRLAKATGVEVNAADDIMGDPTPRAIAHRLAQRSAAATGAGR